MDILLKIIQVILSLSLLVLVHEFGHYITARIFRIRVEKFYLFFPPAILKFKPKKSDTEFGIGCIPLGGFCKISGMIDESMDKESMAKPPQPWEFRSRPAWQRIIVLAGGVLMNVVLAIVLYIAILFTWGEQYIKNDDVIYGIEVSPLAKEIGFENGDRILALDGNPAPDNFNEIHMDMLRDQVSRVTVLRDGDTVDIHIDPVYMPAMLNTPGMFGIRLPIAVGSLPDTSINAGADLRGATIYSSMEPCSQRSSEPESCTQLILRHGFARVVFAAYEPSCFVCCRGARMLREAGVDVRVYPEMAGGVREANAHVWR